MRGLLSAASRALITSRSSSARAVPSSGKALTSDSASSRVISRWNTRQWVSVQSIIGATDSRSWSGAIAGEGAVLAGMAPILKDARKRAFRACLRAKA